MNWRTTWRITNDVLLQHTCKFIMGVFQLEDSQQSQVASLYLSHCRVLLHRISKWMRLLLFINLSKILKRGQWCSLEMCNKRKFWCVILIVDKMSISRPIQMQRWQRNDISTVRFKSKKNWRVVEFLQLCIARGAYVTKMVLERRYGWQIKLLCNCLLWWTCRPSLVSCRCSMTLSGRQHRSSEETSRSECLRNTHKRSISCQSHTTPNMANEREWREQRKRKTTTVNKSSLPFSFL